jgi:hypothetical protein
METREFIGETVEVVLGPEERPRRDPPAPVAFVWRGDRHEVDTVLEAWWDFERMSRRQRGYGEGYQRRAPRRGSYGMGRRHFVVVAGGVKYLLCYDRRPSPGKPGGSWTLLLRWRS